MAWQSEMQAGVSVDQVLSQEAQRTFMSSVYRWMFGGLAITGGLAVYTATNESLFNFVVHSYWLLLIAQFGLVIGISWGMS